jgi:tRNA threonylcarbamoyladenosine biosynthesis protein TsaE
MELRLPDEAATTSIGVALARGFPANAGSSLLLGLSGELGSGKTTLARAFLRELGVDGAIRSPTFTLVEPYATRRGTVHHLDLYRLEPGGAALEGIGFRDIRGAPGLVMVEWPERAEAAIGRRDLEARLAVIQRGRALSLIAGTESGRRWLDAASASLEEYCVSP